MYRSTIANMTNYRRTRSLFRQAHCRHRLRRHLHRATTTTTTTATTTTTTTSNASVKFRAAPSSSRKRQRWLPKAKLSLPRLERRSSFSALRALTLLFMTCSTMSSSSVPGPSTSSPASRSASISRTNKTLLYHANCNFINRK